MKILNLVFIIIAIIVVQLILLFLVRLLSDHDQQETSNPPPPKRMKGNYADDSEKQLHKLLDFKIIGKDFNYDILKLSEEEIVVDLLALVNSVQFIKVKDSELMRLACLLCKTWQYPSLHKHPHNLEYWLPSLLRCNNSFSSVLPLQHSQLADFPVPFRSPLFYFPKIFTYTVAYCWKYGLRKENWKMGVKYLDEISFQLVSTSEWKENKGVDFIIAASHPKSAPNQVESNSLSEMSSHATFLRTDYDINGFHPKDIIVPYYVHPFKSDMEIDWKEKKRLLIFFAGGDHPHNGLRFQLTSQFQSCNDPRTKVIINPSLSREEYFQFLANSEFCLSIRGDTSSSSRLFEIISIARCIPVIISDWIVLPFEDLIDYSKFSIRFPESVVNNVSRLLTKLQHISEKEKEIYLLYLKQAKQLLLYLQPNNALHLLNPITLLFLEIVERRKFNCRKFDSSFCRKLHDRLAFIHSFTHKNNVTSSSSSLTMSQFNINKIF